MLIIEYWNGIQTVVNTPTVRTTTTSTGATTWINCGGTWTNCGASGGGNGGATGTALFGSGSGGGGGVTTGCYTTQIVNTFIEIDEEQYVQHAEYYELARQRGVVFRIRTAEETRLRAEATERLRIVAEQAQRERQVILDKARNLLLSHLSAQQRETFEKNKWFVVVGGRSKTEYRIRTDYGTAGNIDVMAKGKKVASLCCHCRSDIPNEDQFLAQKIALQWDEDNFLKIANRRAA